VTDGSKPLTAGAFVADEPGGTLAAGALVDPDGSDGALLVVEPVPRALSLEPCAELVQAATAQSKPKSASVRIASRRSVSRLASKPSVRIRSVFDVTSAGIVRNVDDRVADFAADVVVIARIYSARIRFADVASGIDGDNDRSRVDPARRGAGN
jgi:hypothetical protein